MHNLLDQTLRYGVFALLGLVGPGLGVLRLARVAPDWALVLPIGTAATAGAYWLAIASGWSWLFPLLIGALDLALVLPPRSWRAGPGPPLRGVLAPGLAVVVVLTLTQYPWNRVAPTGEFLLDPLVPYDTAFHVGLSRELAIDYPPQVPGLSGFPLGYHLGLDLTRAASLRFASVDPYHSIGRFDVTLGALALLLALRGATRAVGAGPLAVALVPWTLLGADFAFVFAGNPQAHWWSDLLRGNILISLALANPVVPALALALGCLIALARHESGEGRGWLAVSALQGLAVPFFKVFLGAHLLLGLAAAAAFRRRSAREVAWVAFPCLAATAALALGQGGKTVEIALDPLDLVRVTRQTLGLEPVSGVGLLLFSLVWLACSYGVRLVGLPEAMRAATRGHAPSAALGAMALAAWPLGLLFRVSAASTLPGQAPINDASYLVEQGGPLLWIFTAIALARLARGGRRAVAVIGAAAGLSLPATVQFVGKKATTPPDPIPAPMVRAMGPLATASAPGDVVMQRPGARYPPLPVVLIGRRVPYERFTPWLSQFAEPEALQRRHEAVYRFFRTTDRAEAIAIARSLGARHLCLYGPDRVRFDTDGLLEPLHEEPQARCYRLLLP